MTLSIDNDLQTLADGIRQKHKQAIASFSDAFTHAVEAGRMLIRAKHKLRHGGWLRWLEDECEIAERTAQAYMRVARLAPQLTAENPQRVADLSVRRAIALLTKPKTNKRSIRSENLRLLSDEVETSQDVLTQDSRREVDRGDGSATRVQVLIAELSKIALLAQKLGEFTPEIKERLAVICREIQLLEAGERGLGPWEISAEQMPYEDI
jgi:Protein of unknown function (DUF3102)